MKRKFALFTLAILLGLVATTNAQNTNSVAVKPATTTTLLAPEYPNVIYTRGTDGTLTALPRATVKVGRASVGLILPQEVPTISGPLVVRLEGSSDPKSLLEIGTGGKSFNKPVEFKVKPLGDRVFELSIAAPAMGDCVVALKGTNPLSMPEMFAFRVEGKK